MKYFKEKIEELTTVVINLEEKSDYCTYAGDGLFFVWREDDILEEINMEDIPQDKYTYFQRQEKSQVMFVFIPKFMLTNNENIKNYYKL